MNHYSSSLRISFFIITPVAVGVRTGGPTKCTMYNTMCSGQTPSLNFTSRTCSKNHINWYKPCRVLHLQALNVDEGTVGEEEENLEQAEGMSCME